MILNKISGSDGEHYVDIDLHVHKDSASVYTVSEHSCPLSIFSYLYFYFKHTVVVSRMTDGEYKKLLTLLPFNPCESNLEIGDPRMRHRERVEKHGNMSISAVCPFVKVSGIFSSIKI